MPTRTNTTELREVIAVIEAGESRRAARAPSLLSLLRKRVAGGRRAQREEFECILEIAGVIAKKDPKALPALVKLIGRAAQARAMTTVLRHPQDAEDCEYEEDRVLFDTRAPITPDESCLEDLKRKVPTPRPMKLGVDLIFPWPWEQGRIINSLCELRPGGSGGKWHQDRNHAVILWLPLGVGWVFGGNHSITAGIIHAQGEVKPEVTYDISRVYKHVVCDGVEYKRVHDNKVIGPVSDLEMAAIFEIGRLIYKRRVSF
jgi:hypothetical protein